MNAGRLARNSFPSTEQSILRTRKPRCPSRSDRASRRMLSRRPAARCSSPRPHPCSSMLPLLSPLPLSLPFATPCVPLSNPCPPSPLSLSLSLSLSSVLRSLVSRSTRNTVYIHTRYTLFSPTASDSRDSLRKSTISRACKRSRFGTSGKRSCRPPRHFRCAGIRTMNELACVIIAPT